MVAWLGSRRKTLEFSGSFLYTGISKLGDAPVSVLIRWLFSIHSHAALPHNLLPITEPAMKLLLSVVVAGVAISVAHGALAADPKAAEIRFFEEKIRPVLVDRCYKCHSTGALEAKALKGQLLLDSRDGIRKGGKKGPAIVPGDVKSSLLIQAIRHESLAMPPKSEAEGKLPDRVIADFVKWVELGAPDSRDQASALFPESGVDVEQGRLFWSFRPLGDATPPEVANGAWVRTPIDRFILRKLEAKEISPNETASRQRLIRRVYFDVWGLPPSPEEVQAFVADSSSDAYENLVDKMLAGRHFGERWARHWLDLARFAESNGYAFDKDRPAAYHFRDFVIKALNEDMPYDEFIRLQIAGDLMRGNDYMAQAATGFLAAGTFTSQQTQKERERSRYEQLDDIISTVGTATLGLTLGCCRCHDHKFDPISQYDYYRMAAAFAEVGFQDFQFDQAPEKYKREKALFDTAHQPFVAARVKYEKEQLPGRLAAWLETQSQETIQPKLTVWQTIGPFSAADFDKAYDQKFPPEAKVDLSSIYDDGKLKWVPQPNWSDGKVHNTLRGDNSANYLFRTIEVEAATPLEISLGRDDAIKVFLNGKQVLAQKVAGGAAPDQAKVKLALVAGRNELLLKVVNGGGPSGFYFKAKDNRPPKNIAAILALAAEKRNSQQQQTLLKWFGQFDAGWTSLNSAESAHLGKQPKRDLLPIFAARKGGATYNFGADTRKVYFLSRGSSNAKKSLATPGFIQVLMTCDEQESHWLGQADAETKKPRHPRVAFADWLTDTERGAGGLLARVIVNRLWQHHFGVGIVNTPSDFGEEGSRPTHPELLEFLAGELIRGGWKLKPIHKLIMTSSVYMQDIHGSEASQRHDPANKLWSRRTARRVEAEVVRDTLLAVSGTLDETMFGPGSLDQNNRRRSVYLRVKRGTLIPILQLFDAPDAMQSIGDRSVTTVPPQALAMMNSPFVRGMAEKLAKRVRPDSEKALEQVIDDAFELSLSRQPSEDERQRMLEFIVSQAKSYGGAPAATDLAVTDYCQLMLSLSEFMFVD